MNAEAAAKINVRQRDTGFLDCGYQVKYPVHRVKVGRHVGDLGADVAINANDFQASKRRGMPVNAHSIFMGNAKLIAFESG